MISEVFIVISVSKVMFKVEFVELLFEVTNAKTLKGIRSPGFIFERMESFLKAI